MIESEARDYLLGHLRSIRKTTKRIRRLERKPKPRRPDDNAEVVGQFHDAGQELA